MSAQAKAGASAPAPVRFLGLELERCNTSRDGLLLRLSERMDQLAGAGRFSLAWGILIHMDGPALLCTGRAWAKQLRCLARRADRLGARQLWKQDRTLAAGLLHLARLERRRDVLRALIRAGAEP